MYCNFFHGEDLHYLHCQSFFPELVAQTVTKVCCKSIDICAVFLLVNSTNHYVVFGIDERLSLIHI